MTETKFERIKDRVAIVGFCNPHREWVPYQDDTLEVWGLNRGYVFMQRADKWFEMHGPEIVEWQQRRPGKHVQWLRSFPGQVVMHQARPEILPNSVDYPLIEVAEDIGECVWRFRQSEDGSGLDAWNQVDAPYVSSTVAQEIALAIYMKYSEIWLYGIDLNTTSEYAWQKPGVEHLLGLAAGRGIKVFVADMCPLLKGAIYGRGYLRPEGEHLSPEQWQERIEALTKQREGFEDQLHELIGGRKELMHLMEQAVPGIDHELMDNRRKSFDQAINQTQGKLIQCTGGLEETLYWAHQTPEGQPAADAIAQISRKHLEVNGYTPDEGPQGIEAVLMDAPDLTSGDLVGVAN